MRGIERIPCSAGPPDRGVYRARNGAPRPGSRGLDAVAYSPFRGRIPGGSIPPIRPREQRPRAPASVPGSTTALPLLAGTAAPDRRLRAGRSRGAVVDVLWGLPLRAVFRPSRGFSHVVRALLPQLDDHESGPVRRFSRSAPSFRRTLRRHAETDRARVERRVPGRPVAVLAHPVVSAPAADRGKARRDLGITTPLVLFLGLVRRYKGVDVLLEAAPRIVRETNARIAIVDEVFPDARPLEAAWKRSPVRDSILWRDEYVAEEEMARWLAACDAVVLPYRYVSGSGIAARAIAARRPMAAASVGGLSETVRPGVTGELFAGRRSELADAVRRIVDGGSRIRGGPRARRGGEILGALRPGLSRFSGCPIRGKLRRAMDFELTEDQSLLAARCASSPRRSSGPARPGSTNRQFRGTSSPRRASSAWPASPCPETGAPEWNGLYSIVIEEISRVCANTGVILSVNNSLVCDPIEKFGNDDQKRRFLVPLARGEKLGCFALTEPDAGSDAANQKTRAVREGDVYRISGQKVFITCGQAADVCLLFAMTQPENGARGISAFLVEADSPGFDRSRHQIKLGVNASGTVEIFLTDVMVPVENRLGQGARASRSPCPPSTEGASGSPRRPWESRPRRTRPLSTTRRAGARSGVPSPSSRRSASTSPTWPPTSTPLGS